MKNDKEVLLTMAPRKLVWHLSIPAIFGLSITLLYSFVDSIYIGKMISKEAMGAITMASTFTWIINAVTMLIGVGSASILSRAIGRNDKATIDKIMGNLTFLTIVLSVLITIPVVSFSESIMRLTGAEGEMLSLGSRYLKTVFLGATFLIFAFGANICLRATGKMKTAMIFMTIGSLLNILLDPIFIIIFKKYDMAIEGVAYATILSQFINSLITFYYFKKKSAVPLGKIKLEPSLLKEVFSIGLSGMFMQILGIVQSTILFRIIAVYGSKDWQILMGASMRIIMFFSVIFFGLGQAFQPSVGANYGAKLYDRLFDIVNVFFKTVIVLGLPVFIILEVFPKELLSLFIDDTSVVEMGIKNFRVIVSSFIFIGFISLGTSFFQALGKAKAALFLVLGRVLLIYVPLVILIPKINHYGLDGVWFAHALAQFIASILTIIFINL